MTTQAEFFQAHQVDGVLTDEQMAQLLQLPEGDTGLPESSAPAAALEADKPAPVAEADKVVPASDAAPGAAEPQPVLLAKDGVHTIDYQKLVEAREDARSAKEALRIATEHAEALQQQLEEAKKTLPAAAAEQLQAAVGEAVDTGLFGDYSEQELADGIGKLMAKQAAAITQTLEARFAAALEPLQRREAMTAEELHFSSITAKHPDAEAIAESAEMEQWIKAQPSYTQPALRAVLTGGTATEVIELMDNFKAATGKTAADPTPTKTAAELAAAAKAVIDKAQARPPTSLTEIPAGSTAHHDEAEAMLEMSSAGLMTKFEGKSPEQIAALLARVL